MEFKRVTEILDKAVRECPDKTGFVDQNGPVTYRQMQEKAHKVAAAILQTFHEDPALLKDKDPVPAVTLMEGESDICAVVHGILYAGDCYSVIDTAMPAERIKKIFDTLSPRLMITNRKMKEKAESLSFSGKILVYEEILEQEDPGIVIPEIEMDTLSTKPAIITFTSGSTGTPKGVVTGHNGVIVPAIVDGKLVLATSSDRVGNQTSLYYALGELILYLCIAARATCYFMPRSLFSEPAELAKYIVDHELTILYWATSGLTVFSRFSAWEGYEDILNKNLRSVTFAGDVISTKLLNKMRKALPGPVYGQAYGATEFYPPFGYHIEREFADDERIPIGFPLEYASAYIVKDDGTLAEDGEEGQLYLAGDGIGLGYLKDAEATKEKFREDPFCPGQRVYLTGDIVKKNEYGEYIFLSRRDFMIKHLGYRVELGEIELAASSLDDQMQCACVFDKEKDLILLVYAGKLPPKELKKKLKDKLQRHMIPNRFIQVDSLPLNHTSKIDREKLKKMYIG